MDELGFSAPDTDELADVLGVRVSLSLSRGVHVCVCVLHGVLCMFCTVCVCVRVRVVVGREWK